MSRLVVVFAQTIETRSSVENEDIVRSVADSRCSNYILVIKNFIAN